MTIKEAAIQVLLDAGYMLEDNYSRPKSNERIKLRLPKTSHRATVGLMTVCLYEVINKQATNFRNFNTKEFNAGCL